ncbi:hypothetical protein P7K49_038387 [Saguinus oedipus]|uniref:Uncharacterized protein n=1 Tax=Saguinus oedipus TaxID=9490 RepID=A0ABQ9TEK4_SAGOE|nr:hypothetical protein P7K49_038387 [Saguinus oedipus]
MLNSNRAIRTWDYDNMSLIVVPSRMCHLRDATVPVLILGKLVPAVGVLSTNFNLTNSTELEKFREAKRIEWHFSKLLLLFQLLSP